MADLGGVGAGSPAGVAVSWHWLPPQQCHETKPRRHGLLYTINAKGVGNLLEKGPDPLFQAFFKALFLQGVLVPLTLGRAAELGPSSASTQRRTCRVCSPGR